MNFKNRDQTYVMIFIAFTFKNYSDIKKKIKIIFAQKYLTTNSFSLYSINKMNSYSFHIFLISSTNLQIFVSANLESTQYDIILYIGLMVAIFIVLLLSYFLVRVYRKKDQHQSLYNMASNGECPIYQEIVFMKPTDVICKV